jgi:hypothetical protein
MFPFILCSSHIAYDLSTKLKKGSVLNSQRLNIQKEADIIEPLQVEDIISLAKEKSS